MRHLLVCRRAIPLLPPPSPPPAPRTPGVAGARLFSSLPLPPLLLSRRQDTDCKVDPRSFEFKKNKFGKPEILWPSDDNRTKWPLHFNISHTSSLIACGITMDTHIGIDIEEKKQKTKKNILSLARRYFTPSEVDCLDKIPDPDAQQKEFIKLWTLKEAYVKALGRGFSGAPFNKFSISLAAENGIQISVAPKVFEDSDSSCDCLSENWQFALAEQNSSHYMAVCLEDDSRSPDSGNGRLPLGLEAWKTVPFLEDTLVSVSLVN